MTINVLLVEDDSDFAESVALNLEECGFNLLGPVSGGLAAFSLCELTTPDVALIDISLDGTIDGIFLGQQLSERDIPVVYLTGRFDRALREGRHHAAALLSKPCSLTELVATLERVARRLPPKDDGRRQAS